MRISMYATMMIIRSQGKVAIETEEETGGTSSGEEEEHERLR